MISFMYKRRRSVTYPHYKQHRTKMSIENAMANANETMHTVCLYNAIQYQRSYKDAGLTKVQEELRVRVRTRRELLSMKKN